MDKDIFDVDLEQGGEPHEVTLNKALHPADQKSGKGEKNCREFSGNCSVISDKSK